MIVFGAVHSIECDSMEQAVYRFMDIFLNISVFIEEWNESTLFIILDNYVQWAMLACYFYIKSRSWSSSRERVD